MSARNSGWPRRRSLSTGKGNIIISMIHQSSQSTSHSNHWSLWLQVCGPYVIPIWAGDANGIRSFSYSCVDRYYMKLCKPTICVPLTDVLSSSEYTDSLQFDHHANVLNIVPVVVKRAIPWRENIRARTEDSAFVIPEPAAQPSRAVASCEYVVVHCRRRKFEPVERHTVVRLDVSE